MASNAVLGIMENCRALFCLHKLRRAHFMNYSDTSDILGDELHIGSKVNIAKFQTEK